MVLLTRKGIAIIDQNRKFNPNKIILDLCGGTGAWSKPYVDAGYDVRLVTLPEQDVRLYCPPDNVYGILAAPPCTHFAVSGARWWTSKGIEAVLNGLSVVDACLRIIKIAEPKFWALENPVGRLTKYIGRWRWTFQPYEFGDPWTKRTCIWGEHNIPTKHVVELGDNADWVHKLPPGPDRAKLRSVTPPGFAQAFFEENK